MIGGNITGQIQLCKTETNIIGSCDKTWETVDDITGYLDLSTGDSKYTTYNAKMQTIRSSTATSRRRTAVW